MKERGIMKKDYFEYCDAFIILTRQGVVLTSDDARLTPEEDDYLYVLTKHLTERKQSCRKVEIKFPEDW